MENQPTPEITQLLARWSAGDAAALESLMPLVYEQLRSLAQRHLRRERSNHTIQPTALVHEAFLRLPDQDKIKWQSREHFLNLASQLMRRILVDHARQRSAQKRGDGVTRVSLDELLDRLEPAGQTGAASLPATDGSGVDFEAVDAALSRLEKLDPGQGKIVELRFFGGLTIDETARAVGLSPATVKREWALARAWLQRELTQERGR
jgi:RNA polymerase sigma factor (TIGR02999 family)